MPVGITIAYVMIHKIVATITALFRASSSLAKHPYSVSRHKYANRTCIIASDYNWLIIL